MPYQNQYSYPFNLSGTIERQTTILGLTKPTRRINKMPSNSISLYKGDNRIIRIYVKDENLDIINLNGAEARLFVAESSKSTSYVLRKTTANYSEGTIRTPERGEIVFFIDGSDTEELEATQYFYQVIVILNNGQRYTVCSDVLTLKSNIEFGEVIPPVVTNDPVIVDISVGQSTIHLTTSPLVVIFPTLLAPSESAENVWITNLVYGQTGVDVFLSASVIEEGWRLSYFSIPLQT